MAERPCAVLFAVVGLALVLSLVACKAGTPSSEQAAFDEALVTGVVDGDTVHVRLVSGQTEQVRLIGVDAPENTTEIERFGGEATAYAHQALYGATVYLETDVELRDAYGRLLAYVWLEVPRTDAEGEMRELLFNAQLLLDGYAQLLTIPPNTRYVERFRTFESEARDAGRGFWGLEKADGVVFWGDAGDHVGEVITIEGPVVGAYHSLETSGQPTFLNIGRDHPDPARVTVFISSRDRGAWSEPPEELYAGATIRVTGKVELYEGVVEIVVTGPDAIEVVE